MWRLELTREATRTMLRMPRRHALRIRARLNDLVRDPYHAPNVKKLTDHPALTHTPPAGVTISGDGHVSGKIR